MIFRNIITSIIGTILMFLSVGFYYASFLMDALSDIGWKQLLWPFVLGLYLLFAKDEDILSPIKTILNLMTKGSWGKQSASNDVPVNKEEAKPEVK